MGRARLPLTTARASAVAFAIAVTASCTRTQSVSVVLHVPPDAKNAAGSYEVGVYQADTCPSIAQLAGGLSRGALVQRIGFDKGSAAPTFRVPKGTYAFAATARDGDCEVLAAGCTAISTSGLSEVAIDLKPVESKASRCIVGSKCRAAECVPAPTRDDVGAGCTLEVVGAGPLQNFIVSGDEVNVGTPVIAAVADGFVIAYRQIDGAKYRLIPLKVGFDGSPQVASEGTPLPFNNYDVKGACPDDVATEGLALAFPGGDANGLLVAPRSPRCTTASVMILEVDPTSHFPPQDGAAPLWAGSTPPTTHVMTNRALTPNGYATSVIDGQARVYTLTANGTDPRSGVDVGGAPPHHHAWVAASDRAIGVLVEADRTPGDSDAGSDGGNESVTVRTELRLVRSALARNQGPSFQTMPSPLARTLGSIAVGDARFAVVTNGPAASPLELRVLDLDAADFRQVDIPSASSAAALGDTLAVDVAVHGDRILVGTMQATGVSVLAFKDFGRTPTLLKRKELASDSKVKPFVGGIFEALRDGAVAVAGSDGRIGVVWTTAKRVAQGEELGGWAVLSCN